MYCAPISTTVSGLRLIAVGAVSLLVAQLSTFKAPRTFRHPTVLLNACSYHHILTTTHIFPLISLAGAINASHYRCNTFERERVVFVKRFFHIAMYG